MSTLQGCCVAERAAAVMSDCANVLTPPPFPPGATVMHSRAPDWPKKELLTFGAPSTLGNACNYSSLPGHLQGY